MAERKKKTKHAEAITKPGRGPWYDWLESDEGRLASDHSSLPIGRSEYLENRLWRAFTAGMKAGFEQERSR